MRGIEEERFVYVKGVPLTAVVALVKHMESSKMGGSVEILEGSIQTPIKITLDKKTGLMETYSASELNICVTVEEPLVGNLMLLLRHVLFVPLASIQVWNSEKDHLRNQPHN